MPSAPPTSSTEPVGRPPSATIAIASPADFSFRRLALQWVPPILWMAAILLASNDWLSAQETEGWLRKILVALFGPIPVARLKELHFLARKAGHLLSYAVLAWLSYRSARASQPATKSASPWRPRAALYGFAFTAVTASLDELHQAFTQMRSGTLADVALDMAGALSALICIWMVSRWKRVRVGASPGGS